MTLPFVFPEELGRRVKIYSDALKDAGYDLATRRILTKVHVYVSDSLEQAVHEATPYLQHFSNVRNAANPNRKLDRSDFASQMAQRFIIAGDPQRCIDTIHNLREELFLTTLSGTFHFGGMPHEMAMKNIRRFAEHVMPAFK